MASLLYVGHFVILYILEVADAVNSLIHLWFKICKASLLQHHQSLEIRPNLLLYLCYSTITGGEMIKSYHIPRIVPK